MTRWLFALLLLLPSLAVAQTSRGPVDVQNFGTTPFLTPGSATARTDAARWGDVRNAVDWGADPTGVADSTAALNNALAADGNGVYHNVYLPPGIAAQYHVTNVVTVHPGQCLVSDNSTQVMITIGYDYNSSAGSPLALSGNSFGTPCVEHVMIAFTQPASIGTRSNFATLASGCGGNGKGCEYPAAIDLTNATNATLDDVFILGAWDCVTATWATSNADTEIRNIRCGAFDKGLNLAGSTGIVNLTDYHFFPWGIGVANLPIYTDGNTYSAVFTSMGGINAKNYFSSQGRLLITGSAQPSFAYFTDPIMDQDNATFEVNSTSEIITITGGHSVGSSTGADTACELNITAGVPSVMVSSHEFRGNTDSAAGLICSAGGNLNVSNSELVVAATGDKAVVQTGGNLIFKGNDIVATGVHTVPLISSTSGTYNISGNSVGLGGGSGVGISVTDAAGDMVSGNALGSGWTFTVPAGASLLGKYYPNAGGPTFAVSQGAPANPTGTTSTAAFVMMGMAQAFTPAINGKVQLHFDGICTNSGANDALEFQLRYGTGTAPINGAALAGSAVSSTVPGAVTVSAANQWFSCSQIQIVAGLTVGTAYWYDVAVEAVTGGTAALANVTMNANELP